MPARPLSKAARLREEAWAALVPKVEFPEELPISARAEEVIQLLAKHPVVVLAGETGSGKTTQIPKMLLAAGFGCRGQIACTQPRRVAALSVSKRIAQELGCQWGQEVGAKIRFTDETGPRTCVKMLTDGMLLAEIQGDPLLRAYDAIVVDEAHERSLNIDFLLGYLRQLRLKRPELRIVITSATIDTAKFAAAFSDAPVVEVSGRTFPVEVRYRPLEDLLEGEGGDFNLTEGCARALDEVMAENRPGDALVFLPGERDIRELMKTLEGRFRGAEILPLFGRLSNAEQERIFASSRQRKIILATNIAETSITVPGIRYVIDPGMARISRYSAHTRTQRLPIESVAQSSAEQRKGRAGRVADGICVRLYDEKDFLARPKFTTPEIQRSNLAAVILRLEAMGLGDVAAFPFLDPPTPASITGGYRLLQELGAMEAGAGGARSEKREARMGQPDTENRSPVTRLTPLGQQLARLPCDPTVGRMLLEAQKEGVMREVLVIAAGLCIQDPRDRPLDHQEAADQQHRKFQHAESDFLTLLKIWDTFHEEMERLTNRQLKRFCESHFLNYRRMREWRDIHTQLGRLLEEVGAQREGGVPAAPSTKPFRAAIDSQPKKSATAGKTKSPDERRGHRSHVDANAIDPAQYAAIHRALLAGLLGNLGMRDEGNHFKVTHGRAAMIFPGSGLFDKQAAKAERKKFKGQQKPAKVSGHRTPPWIMCAEWMETQRLYARTVARIDPAWVLRLGGHLLKSSYGDPRYEEKGERVVVRERRRLYGLEIDARWVGYVRLNRKAAREIFVREALGEGLLQSQPPWFVANQKLRAEIEDRLTRQRDTSSWQVDERVAAFYERVLGDAEIGSYADLRRWLKEAQGGKDAVLYLSEPDLLRDPHALDTTLYPDAVQAADGTKLALAYTYQPGEQVDGATLKVPVGEVAKLDAAMLDWAVPGYISEKVEHLLRGLPKETRKKLHPLGPKAKELASLLEPGLAGNAKCRMQNAKEGADSDDDAVTAKANPSPSRAASLTDLDKLVGDTVRPKPDERSAVTGHPDSLLAQITRHIRELYGVKVWPDEWDLDAVPAFLKPRVEVVDAKGTVVAEGRDWEKVRATYEAATRADRPGTEARAQRDAWSQAVARFTRPHLTTFSCGDHPREVTIAQVHGVPLKGFPGLSLESGEERAVTLTLFRTEAEARAATVPAFSWLVEQAVAKELIWLEKDLGKELKRVHVVASPLIPSATLQRDALAFTRRQLTAGTDPLPLQRTTFEATVRDARASLRGWPQQLTDHLQAIFAQRQRLLLIKRGYPSLREDLSALLPIDFLRVTPPDRLPHLPRYLEAMVIRAEKFARDPRKDAEKAALVARYQGGLAASPKEAPGVPSPREELRWALEEYRVSLFAQHLGTAEKVSEPRLEALRRAILGETAPPRPDPRATQATAAPEATARQRKLSHADLTALFGAKR